MTTNKQGPLLSYREVKGEGCAGIRGEPAGNSFLIGAQWGGGAEAEFSPAQSLPQAASHLLGRPKASLQDLQGWPSSTPEPKDREGEGR